MDEQTILQVIQILSALVQAGIATEQQIADAIRAHAGEVLSDDALNTIIDGVVQDAQRRKAIADADAAGSGSGS
jgi:hypothetical protein